MTAIGKLHRNLIFGRRTRVLSKALAQLLPTRVRVLDVGCGDGTIDRLIMEARPDVHIEGIDVLVRPQTDIQVTRFDGHRIPFADASFDVVMFVDVLHHTADPAVLLQEATRIARRFVVLKDHTRDGLLANATLRLMDWVGNAHHRVVLPYNYLSKAQWDTVLARCKLRVDTWVCSLGLYPFPASLAFDRRLHFVARLQPVS
jgi:SAM-dependent methyltransferase